MKKLITIFVIFLCYYSQAQRDTIPIVMMVSDTSINHTEYTAISGSDTTWYSYPFRTVSWQFGYEVRDSVIHWGMYEYAGGEFIPSLSMDHVEFLDDNKVKISDRIVVWDIKKRQ